MTLLDQVFGVTPAPVSYAPHDDYWYQPFGMISAAGVPISEEAALRVSAVYRAVELKAQTMGRLPFVLFRRLPEDRKERAFDESLYEVLHDRPNDTQSAHGFKELMQGVLELRGNAYAEILSGRRGFVDQLIPLHPAIVEPVRLSNRRVGYDVWENGKKRRVTQDRMFHIRGFGTDGLQGLSRIALMRETIGLALATESHGARVFSQRANHAGVLQHPGVLDSDTFKRLRASFDEQTTGLRNAHRPLILEEGMTWQTIGMSNDDAEFILTRTFQLKEIARWFGVPPHKIADLDKSSFNNIEEQGIDFVQDGIAPQASRWEGAVYRSLIPAPDLFARFIVDALLRGKTKERYEAHNLAINGGWKTRNEAREQEDMNRADGLDEFLEPMNMRRASVQGMPTNDRRGSGGSDGGGGGDDDTENEAAIAATVPPAPKMSARAEKILHDAAARMVRREVEQIQKRAVRFADDQEAWTKSLHRFYRDHAIKISEVLHLPLPAAESYCKSNEDALVVSGLGAADTWIEEQPKELARLAMSEE